MEGKSQNQSKRKTKKSSTQYLKELLAKNKISLEHLGDEKAQDNFINELSKAIYKCKNAGKNFMEDTSKENLDARNKAASDLEELMKKGNFSEGFAKIIRQKAIPYYSQQQQKSDILKMKEKMDILEKQNAMILEEIKKERSRRNPQEQAIQDVDDSAPINDEAEVVDDSVTVQAKSKVVDDSVTVQAKSKVVDDRAPIQAESEVVDKRDETAGEILKDMINQNKELRRQRKDLEKNSPETLKLARKNKSIMRGAANIASAARDLYDLKVYREGISNLDHNIMAGTAMILGTGAVIGGYVAGRVALKTIKGVAKIGVKATIGTAVLAGKAGVKLFKAAKGTAKKCKDRADKKRELKKLKKEEKELQRKNKKLERKSETIETLNEMDMITSEILKAYKERYEDSRYLNDNALDSELDLIQQHYLSDIRNYSNREETEEEIIRANEELLVGTKKLLRDLPYGTVEYEFLDKFGIKESETRKIINSIEIDANGELVFPEDSPITYEEVEKIGLIENIKRIKQMPKVKDLDIEDIEGIVAYIDSGMNPRRVFEDGLITKKAYEYIDIVIEEISNDKGEIFLEDYDKINDIKRNVEIFYTNYQILQEAYDRDLYELADELREQSLKISKEVALDIDSDKRKDVCRREELRKIAEEKIAALKDAGIVGTIQKDDEKQVSVLTQAGRILSQDLIQPLEEVIDIKRKKVEKDFRKNPENEDIEQDF